MKSSYTTLMQSKYFNAAFNSAIFDGPVRIYFAQFHESLALKIYFLIQQKLTAEVAQAKAISKASGANILVMIYPTEESFLMSFESEVSGKANATSGSGNATAPLAIENWQEDIVIGLRGPLEDEHLDGLVETLRQCILTWQPASLPIDAKSGYAATARL